MMRHRTIAAILVIVSLAGLGASWAFGPRIAASALLYPMRNPVTVPPPSGCTDATFDGVDAQLSGWRCAAQGTRLGTLIMLHGVAANRVGLASAADWFTAEGFDVIAYDSRAHGNSGGEACTYGYLEKEDLRRVIDTLGDQPVALLGTSLGAAIALQEAADDPRVRAVVAAEVFADLRSLARDRVPYVPQSLLDRAFAAAEARARFDAAAVDVEAAARRMTRPVFLIHGADDVDTPPAHSRRVYNALRGAKQLLLITGAGHNQSLQDGGVWRHITEWLVETVQSAHAAER